MTKKRKHKWHNRIGSFIRRQSIRTLDAFVDTGRSIIYDKRPFSPLIKYAEDTLDDSPGSLNLKDKALKKDLLNPVIPKSPKEIAKEQDEFLEFIQQHKKDQRKRHIVRLKKEREMQQKRKIKH